MCTVCTYYLLYDGIGFWSLNKLSIMEKSLMNSSYQHLIISACRGGSRKFRKGWLGHSPTCQLYVETFYCSENSLQNNIYKIISRTKLCPLNLPLLLLNVIAPLGKLLQIQKFSSHSRAFMLVNQPLSCSISDYSLSWQMLLTHWTPHELLH